jgi:hypothetical protein
MTGRSEYDDGGDQRTELQKAYGARLGDFGDSEGQTFAGLDPQTASEERKG